MSSKYKFFSPSIKSTFSPSTHWEHCLLLENDMLDILKYIPIHVSMPNENFKVSSPKLVDVFVRACFLFEAALKGISTEPTDRIAKYLKENKYSWSNNLLQGKNCLGNDRDLDICDFLSFYEKYCSLSTLEVRVRYSQNISDIWINQMLMVRPFYYMTIEDDLVKKSPEWWRIYNNIKHNFYSYPSSLNLEITLNALAALISFSAVVPQMRRLLCDHGYIQDNSRNPISIGRLGRRLDGRFHKDEWVNHQELVLEGCTDRESLPAIACVSNLFIVPFVDDYKGYQLWSGLNK